MIYGSVCSGIESASVAWGSLGWKPAWFAEILSFPSAVLKHHYPSVPNLGDMTRIHESQTFSESKIDLLVGGTPCQSFSSAGKRQGLDDPRGNLALWFLRIAQAKRPRWLVWENVPGVLSSNGGKDFGSFLWQIQELGYSCAWRVLDAQGFGVPQRRRRVFIVGCLGDWRHPVAALFEAKDLLGCLEEGKDQGKDKILEVLEKSDLPVGIDIYNYAVTGKVAATVGANCFSKNSHGPRVLDRRGIRIHTPLECERLQGFPDDYTKIPFATRAETKMDEYRIKALGNSMAVPVMRWIGERIQAADETREFLTCCSEGIREFLTQEDIHIQRIRRCPVLAP